MQSSSTVWNDQERRDGNGASLSSAVPRRPMKNINVSADADKHITSDKVEQDGQKLDVYS